jgi:hypothetical protein
MGILLAFAPFIVFALADRFVSPASALAAAAAVSAILLLRELFTPGHTPKILELGTFLLFAGLALYAFIAAPSWTVIGVRLRVDAGLLVIILISMAVRRPFTLQYAREQVPVELWANPDFLRANYVITAAWAAAFLFMVLAELALLFIPGFPHRAGIVVITLALIAAVKFTGWYPDRPKGHAVV